MFFILQHRRKKKDNLHLCKLPFPIDFLNLCIIKPTSTARTGNLPNHRCHLSCNISLCVRRRLTPVFNIVTAYNVIHHMPKLVRYGVLELVPVCCTSNHHHTTPLAIIAVRIAFVHLFGLHQPACVPQLAPGTANSLVGLRQLRQVVGPRKPERCHPPPSVHVYLLPYHRSVCCDCVATQRTSSQGTSTFFAHMSANHRLKAMPS